MVFRCQLILILVLLCGTLVEAVCVSRTEANLYKQPNARSVVVTKLEKFTPLKWTGKRQAGFFEVVDFEGVKAWVPVVKVSARMTCLQVKVKKSFLRTGPGSSFPKAEIVAEKRDVFRDLGGEDGWTMIETSAGKRAWINLDHTWKPLNVMRMSFDRRE